MTEADKATVSTFTAAAAVRGGPAGGAATIAPVTAVAAQHSTANSAGPAVTAHDNVGTGGRATVAGISRIALGDHLTAVAAFAACSRARGCYGITTGSAIVTGAHEDSSPATPVATVGISRLDHDRIAAVTSRSCRMPFAVSAVTSVATRRIAIDSRRGPSVSTPSAIPGKIEVGNPRTGITSVARQRIPYNRICVAAVTATSRVASEQPTTAAYASVAGCRTHNGRSVVEVGAAIAAPATAAAHQAAVATIAAGARCRDQRSGGGVVDRVYTRSAGSAVSGRPCTAADASIGPRTPIAAEQSAVLAVTQVGAPGIQNQRITAIADQPSPRPDDRPRGLFQVCSTRLRNRLTYPKVAEPP